MKRVVLVTLTCICTGLLPAAALAQHEQHGGTPPDDIGARHVNFTTSCTPEVRADFNKGVALLHSFWFPEARRGLETGGRPRRSAVPACWGRGGRMGRSAS